MVKGKNNYIYILQLELFIHTELQVLLYKSQCKTLSPGVQVGDPRGCWAAGATIRLAPMKGKHWASGEKGAH